jgi:hypothetical protein
VTVVTDGMSDPANEKIVAALRIGASKVPGERVGSGSGRCRKAEFRSLPLDATPYGLAEANCARPATAASWPRRHPGHRPIPTAIWRQT